MGMQPEANVEDELWASHTARVRAGKPKIQAVIKEVSGWPHCEKLADFVVELIIANQGTSGHEEPRPPCWRSHAPATVQEYTEQLALGTSFAVDSPEVQALVAAYRQKLIEQFGLDTK